MLQITQLEIVTIQYKNPHNWRSLTLVNCSCNCRRWEYQNCLENLKSLRCCRSPETTTHLPPGLLLLFNDNLHVVFEQHLPTCQQLLVRTNKYKTLSAVGISSSECVWCNLWRRNSVTDTSNNSRSIYFGAFSADQRPPDCYCRGYCVVDGG